MKYFNLTLILSSVLLLSACKKDTVAPTIESSTTTVSNWIWDNNDKLLYADMTWSAITSDVVDNGTIHIYLKTSGGDWAPLPRTVMLSGTFYDYAQSQRFTFNVGRFQLIVQDDDLLQPANPGTWTIRVVAVSGAQRFANPDLDWDNYEAVKNRFSLVD
jgi:hypothetical protein